MTRQLTEAVDKLVEHKEEELNRLRQWTEEHQERLSAEEKAKEENSKYASNSLLSALKYLSPFHLLFSYILQNSAGGSGLPRTKG